MELQIPRIAILIEASRSSSRGLLRGISKYAHVYGPWAFCRLPPFYKGIGRGEWPICGKSKSFQTHGSLTGSQAQIDGMIAHVASQDIIKSLIPKGCPAVIVPVDEVIPDLPNLVSDGDKTGKIAAEYLKDLGLRHFAFCGYNTNYWSRERLHGFQKTLKRNGHNVKVFNQKKRKSRRIWEGELTELAGWLQTLPRPVGVWVWNDDLAQYVVQAAKVAGLQVPEDIAVLGVDDDELICSMCSPSLSSLALNFERAGYEMAESLHGLMKRQKVRGDNITLHSTSITVRNSTNILAMEDQEVAQALRFIYENSLSPLQVEDVVNAVTISRRCLYERFPRVVGRTVYEEIMRVRGDRIAKILVETNDPINKIALDTGFTGAEHISRFFKKTKGMSPCQYRLKYGQR